MKLLFRIWLLTAAVALPLSALGAMSYFFVTPEGVTIRPFFSGETRYAWTEIRAVEVRCHAEGYNLHLNYRLEMNDGATVDLMQEGPLVFLRAYDRIKAHLDARPDILYHRRMTPSGKERLERTYAPDTVRRIRRILEGEEKP